MNELNMIERIAIVLYHRMTFGHNLTEQHQQLKEHYQMLAKAAIEAMVEPTEEMLKEDIVPQHKETYIEYKFYQKMIQAALEGK